MQIGSPDGLQFKKMTKKPAVHQCRIPAIGLVEHNEAISNQI